MSETTSQNAIPSPAEPVPDEFDLLCEQCGYSLIGLIDSTRCPECGKAFDPNDLPLARVPWLYRARLGTFWAYWRTVLYVLCRPAGFARELCRPVRISATDACAFRRMSIRIGLVAIITPIVAGVIVAVAYPLSMGYSIRTWMVQFLFIRACVIAIAFTFAAWVLLTLGTDLPTFIWKGISQKSYELAPVHHYASAPLTLMPFLTPVVVALGILEYTLTRSDNFVWALWCLAAIIFIQLLAFSRTATVLMRAATGCGRGRQVALFAYLVLHWALIGFLSMIICGLALTLVYHMFHFSERYF